MSLNLGYAIGILLQSCLLFNLFLWDKKYKNLKVLSIIEQLKEIFCLANILSNSIGTAFDDFLHYIKGLTYLNRALVTVVVILAVVLLF